MEANPIGLVNGNIDSFFAAANKKYLTANSTCNQANDSIDDSVLKNGFGSITYSEDIKISTDFHSCPAGITALTNINSCSRLIVQGLNIEDPNAGIVSLRWRMTGATDGESPSSGRNQLSSYVFNEGVTVVSYEGRDRYNNSINCSFTVTISDSQAPRFISSPGDITVGNTPGECGADVYWSKPIVNDNCVMQTQLAVSCNYRSGQKFPVGSTAVEYTVSDGVNIANHNFKVTVVDDEPPELIAPPTLEGQCGEPVPDAFTTWKQYGNAGGKARDNCNVDFESFKYVSQTSSGIFCPYTVTRTYSIADFYGNVAQVKHYINVIGEGMAYDAKQQQEKKTKEEVVLKSGAGTKTVDISASITDVTCSGGTDGAIDITLTLHNGPVTDITWTNGAKTEDITGLSQGTYSVEITDSLNSTTSQNYIVGEPNSLVPPGAPTDQTICYNTSPQNLTATPASGGTAPYSNQWQSSPDGLTWTDISGTGLTLTSLQIGSLTTVTYFRIRVDDGFCPAVYSNVIPITVNPLPTASISGTIVVCQDGLAPLVTFTGANGTAPYTFTYSINNGTNRTVTSTGNSATVTVPTSNSGVFDYRLVRVEDNNGCIQNQSGLATITVNPTPTVDVVPNQLVCAGSLTTAITFSGTATSYYWTNTNSAIGLVANGIGNIGVFIATNVTGSPISGTVEVTPIYVNGGVTCTGTSEIFTVTVNPTPSVNSVPNQTVCAGSSTTAITFSGTATLYNWTNTNPSIGLVASGSGNIGAFTATNATGSPISGIVEVTPVYVNGGVTCTVLPVSFVITVTPPISASAAITDSIVCYSGTGTVQISASGGTPPYQYNFEGRTSNSNGIFSGVSGSVAGTDYDWSVTDANGCIAFTGTITITEPPELVASAEILSEIDCYAGTGTIRINASGGTNPLKYTLNGITQSDGVYVGITNGIWVWSVNDNKFCGPATGTITIVEPTGIFVSASVSSEISCYGETGTVTLVASGGTGPYEYTFNGQTNSTGVFSGIYAGIDVSYSVTDVNNCGPVFGSITIDQPDELTSFATPSHVNCNGATTGSIDLTVVGGSAPYSFAWSNGNIIEDPFNLAAGTYTVTITDNRGCTTTTTTTVTEPTKLITAESHSAILCFGGNSLVEITASGGTPGYEYSIDGGANYQASNSFNLLAGSYTLRVIDSRLCISDDVPFSIAEPVAVSITGISVVDNEICEGESIQLNSGASGGTGTLIYSWLYPDGSTHNGQNPIVPNATMAHDGSYTLTVSDVNSCSASNTVGVTVHPSPDVTAIPAVDEFCSGSATNISLSSSVPLTTFSWTVVEDGVTGALGGGGSTITQALTATGSVQGTATYTITPHANNCDGLPIDVVVTVNPIPVATVAPDNAVFCHDAEVNVEFGSNVTGTTFEWSAVLSDIDNNGPDSGTGSSIQQTLEAQWPYNDPAITYTAIPTADGCVGAPVTSYIEIALWVVNNGFTLSGQADNSNVCHGDQVTYNLQSQNGRNYRMRFTYESDNPDIGLVAMPGDYFGTGNSNWGNVSGAVTFTAINNTGVSQTANIVFTAVSYWRGTFEKICEVESEVRTITVDPFIMECPADYAEPAANNLCSTPVTITDPNIICPPPIEVTWDMNGATTAVSPNSGINYIAPVPYSFNVGATTVDYAAEDAFGNLTSCTFDVIITDDQDPTLTCPGNSTVYAEAGKCGADFNFTVTADDNCSATLIQTDGTGLIDGSEFPVGTTTLSFYAEDPAGNSTTCNFDITVIDTISPVISNCVGDQTVCAPSGLEYVNTNNWDPTVTENCPGVITLLYTLTGAKTGTGTSLQNVTFPVGTTIVEWTATDINSNSSTCNFNVTVNEEPSAVIDQTDPSVCLNGAITLTSTAIGTPAPTFQWIRKNSSGVWENVTDGGAYSGATTSDLTISTVVATDETEYAVVVTNSCTTFTSDLEMLSVSTAPIITQQPSSQSDCRGESVLFRTAATGGNGTYTYYWERKRPVDAAFNDASNDSRVSYPAPGEMLVERVGRGASANGTEYQVTVTDDCGNSVTSLVAALTVNFVDSIATVFDTICEGDGTSFTMTTTGSTPIEFIWRKYNTSTSNWQRVNNGGAYSGAETATLTINNATPSESGMYSARARFNITVPNNNSATTCLETDNRVFGEIFIDEGPAIVASIESQSICSGSAITDIILSNANGTPGTIYTWTRSNTTALTGISASGTGAIISGVLTSLTPESPVTTTFTITAIANGCESTSTVTVTVMDDEAPTVDICPTNIVIDTDPTDCNANVTYTLPTFNDNCDGSGLTGTMISGFRNDTIFPFGTTTVTYEYYDLASNGPATCSFNVTLNDNADPIMLCKDTTVHLDDAGVASIVANDVDGGTTDGCGLSALDIDISTFDCTNIGANTITLSATDLYGNSAFCTASVTIIDTVKPLAVCTDITTYVDATGNASINAADIDDGSSDACGIASVSISPSSFTCTNLGANNVTLSVTDNNGNTQTCSALVTVLDTIAPTQNTCQGDITVTTDPLNCSSVINYTVPVFNDNCDGVALAGTLVEGFASGDVFPFGNTTVKYIYEDVAGNTSDTCSFEVNVVDNQPPVALCKDLTIQLDDAGLASITAGDIDNGSSDGCGIDSLRIDISNFTCAIVGANTITLTAVDLYGNDAICTSTVTVADTVKPEALCKDLTVYVDATGNVIISSADIDNGSSDACGIASLVLPVNSFDCTNLGTNSVELNVTDNNGNLEICTSTVTILDSLLPTVANCPGEIVINTDPGLCTATVTYAEPTFNDNCEGLLQTGTLISGLVSGASFPIDTTTVVYEYSDGSGNGPVHCSFNVIVGDNEDPTVLCQDITIQLDAAGLATIIANNVDGGSYDGCGIDSLQIDVSDFNCTNIGDNAVTLTATDLSGNTSTCQAAVTVADDNFPVNITASVSQTPILCYNETATITVATTDGVGILTFEFDGVSQSGNTFISVSAGTYSWSVSDPFNCGDTAGTFEVLEPEILSATIAALDVTCSSGNDGEIRITNSSGGDGSYEYTNDGGTNWQSDSIFSNLAPSIYNIQIRDGNGCFEVLDANLEIIILSADLATNNVSCYGGNDGSIALSNPDGGTGNYQFTINGGVSWQDFVSGSYVYSSLVADTFDVRIRDAGDLTCIIPLDTALVISQPDSLFALVDSANITCFQGANGTITISASTGGTGPHEYSIDAGLNWQSSGDFINLDIGYYDVRIRDSISCEKILNASLVLSQPEILDGVIDSTNISCNGYNDGEIIILSSTGGSGVYEYTVDGGTNWQTDTAFSGLYAGMYDVRIRDLSDTACIISLNTLLELSEPPAMIIANQPIDITDCLGASIQIGVESNGGAGTITYNWQRRKPLEGNFSSIPFSETNALNQDTDSLLILNIGNTDSPDGTQYRVVVADSCSTLISDTVIVNVNQITGVTPNTDTTEICEGENYLLQVLTSGAFPTAYQWQIDSTGTWENLSDDAVLNGSSTNQLTITGATLSHTGQYRVQVTFPATIGTDCNLTSETFERNLIVHPVPTVGHTDSIIVCDGDIIPDIEFTGIATSFNWINDNTAIGLLSSGSGDILSYLAVNTDTVPIVANIEVTPYNIYCDGIKDTFTIVINPTPSTVAPIGVIFCDSILTTLYPLTRVPSNTVFRIEGGSSIGLSDTTGVAGIPPFVPIAGTTNLTVTPIAYGCEGNPVNFDVSVMATPIASISGGDTVCQGVTATNLIFGNPLLSVVEATYTINDTISNTIVIPAATPVQVPVPTNIPGNFVYDLVSVRYITDPYCINTNVSGTATITVIEPPSPTIDGPNSICAGTVDTVYTTEPGMFDYVWNVSSGGTITSGDSTNTVTINWHTDGNQNVSVRYANNNGCTATIPTIYPVTVNAVPIPAITGSGDVCGDDIENYSTLSGMTNYRWDAPGGNIISGMGTNSISVEWVNDGPQTVSVNFENASGCIADSVTLSATLHSVDVHPEPEPVLSGPDIVCSGDTSVYRTDPGMGNTYVWTISGGAIISGTFSDSIATVVWHTAGSQTISVNYTDLNGCTADVDSTLNVTVHQSPDPTISGPALICAGSTNAIYHTDTGMSNYSWNVSVGGSIIGVAIDSVVHVTWNTIGAHTISVDYMNPNDCYAVSPTVLDVTAVDEVVPTMTGVTSVCQEESAQYSTESGMSDYVWSVTGGSFSAGGDSLDHTATVRWDTAGVQSVSVHYLSVNGCISIDTIHPVVVDPVTVPTISDTSDACLGGIVTYNTEPGMTDYQWIISPGGVISGGVSDEDSVTVEWNMLGAQWISVNYTSPNGCRSTSATTKNIFVNDVTPVFCPDDTTICVTTGLLPLSGATPGGGIYSGTGVTGGAFNPDTPSTGEGVYSITYSYTNANNCESTCSFNITVEPAPSVQTQFHTVCSGYPIDIDLSALVPGATFSWTSSHTSGAAVSGFTDCSSACDTMLTDILINASTKEPGGSNGSNGVVTYSVTVTDNGCSDNFDVVVTVRPSIIELDLTWNSNFVEDFIEVCVGAEALSSNDIEIWIPDDNDVIRDWSYFSRGGDWNETFLYGPSDEGPWIELTENYSGEGPYQQIVDFSINDRLGYHYFVLRITDPVTGCEKLSNVAILNIVSSLEIEAGGPDFMCSSASPSSYVLEGAGVGGILSSGLPPTARWTDNVAGGSFSSSSYTQNPEQITYTPPANYSGDIILTLTTENPGGGCDPIADERIVTVIPSSTFEGCVASNDWLPEELFNSNGYLDTNNEPCAVRLVGSNNSFGNFGSTDILNCSGVGTLSFDWSFSAPANEIVWHKEGQKEGDNNGYSSRMYVEPPADLEVGDLIIITIHVNGNTGTITDNEGLFTQIRRDTQSSGRATVASFWKFATPADVSRTTDYRFNMSNVTSNDKIYSSRVTGHSTSNPIISSNGTTAYFPYQNGEEDYRDITINGIGAVNNALLVTALTVDISGDNELEYPNSPVGMTTVYYDNFEAISRVATEHLTGSSTGNKTFSWPSYNSRNRDPMYAAAQMFAIRPATPDVDEGYYLINGNLVSLSSTNGESGTVNVAVSSGDEIGFGVSTNRNTGGPGELTIYNLNVPNDAPLVSGDTLKTYAQCQPEGFNPDTAFVAPTVFDECDEVRLQSGFPVTNSISTPGCDSIQTRTWLYVDSCGAESDTFTQTIIWTVIDTVILYCPPNGTLPACSNTADIQTSYDNWKLGFSVSGGCGSVVDNMNEFPVLPDLTCGGELSFTYVAYDACGQEDSCSSQFVVLAADDLHLTCPNDTVLSACTDTADIRTAYEAWKLQFAYVGGCTALVNDNLDSIPDFSDLPDLSCGGTVDFRLVVNLGSPSCPNSIDCYRTFEVAAPENLEVVVPENVTLPLCSDTASIIAAYNTWVAAFDTIGGCDVITNINSIPTLPDLICGGKISFVFQAENGPNKCADFAVDSSSFEVTVPPPMMVECPTDPNLPGCSGILAVTTAYNNWVDGFTASGGCDITSNIDSISPLGDLLCDGQLSFAFIATSGGDVCVDADTCTSTFTIGGVDSLYVICPGDTTVEGCSASDVEDAFNDWIAQFDTVGGCDVSVTDLSIYSPPVSCGGVVLVNYIATDKCGQADSCSAEFRIEAPELFITVPADTLQNACQTQLDIDIAFADWINQFGYTGGCNVLATDTSAFSAPDICGGTVAITYSASGTCGQSKTGSAFFGIDFPNNVLQEPTFDVPADITISKDSTCGYDADPSITGIPVDLTDNCTHIDSLSVSYIDSIVDGSCLGEELIYRTWEVTDNCLNSTRHLQLITVIDTTPPTITCPVDVSEDADLSLCFKTGLVLDTATATDNCTPIDQIVITNNAPDSFPVGTTVVTWTATDDCGNAATCTQNVTIIDINPPEFTFGCPQDTNRFDAASDSCEATITLLPPDYHDPCGEPVYLSHNSPYGIDSTDASGTYPLGTTPFYWYITDASGNVDSCEVVVIVSDVTSPVINCPSDAEDFITDGGCTLVGATIGDPTFSDNCSVDSLIFFLTGATVGSGTSAQFNYASSASFNVGITTVTYIVFDGSNLSDTCSHNVWIKNLLSPNLTVDCNSLDVSVQASGDSCNLYVVLPAPTVNNPCNEAYTIEHDSPYGTDSTDASGIYPVGLTVVTWTVTDASGNIFNCVQTVELIDVAPVINCPSDAEDFITDGGCTLVGATIGDPTFSDNCSVDSLIFFLTGATIGSATSAQYNYASSATFNVGITTVTYIAFDQSGLSDTCSHNVWIKNLLLPNLTVDCNSLDVSVQASGDSCNLYVALPVPTVNNPCNEAYTIEHDSPYGTDSTDASGIYPVGLTVVTWTVTDASGNIFNCVQTVEPIDVAPVINCPSDAEDFITDGGCTLVGATIGDPTFSDNCSVDSLVFFLTGATVGSGISAQFNYASSATYNVGITTVTYIAFDAGGLTDTCSHEVWVKNLTAPNLEVTCPPDVIQDADAGECYGTVVVPVPTIVDACDEGYSMYHNSPYGIDSTNASGQYPIDTTSITWTIIDASGNEFTCEQDIIVNDLLPTLDCPSDIVIPADSMEIYASGVVIPPPTFDDNCPDSTLTWVMTGATTGVGTGSTGSINLVPSPDTFNVGITYIEYTFVDIHGHIVICDFTVTVEAAPDIECPPSDTFYVDNSGCTYPFDPGIPTVVSGASPFNWTWDMTGVNTGSGSTNAAPLPDPIGIVDFSLGLTTITWTASNVSGVDVCDHHILVIDTIPPKFTAAPYENCVDPIHWAIYNPTAPNPVYGVGKNMEKSPSPDYRTFEIGDTSLDLLSLEDNCCDSTEMTIHWEIVFTDVPDPLDSTGNGFISHDTISGTGQPSEYINPVTGIRQEIKLWGDGVHFNDVTHTITYWVEDCKGDMTEHSSRTIVITPRPAIIKEDY